MDQIVKCLLLKNDLIVISEIVEVAGEKPPRRAGRPPALCPPRPGRTLNHVFNLTLHAR